jgi:hypothetical protein
MGTVGAIDGRPIGAPKADRRQASHCVEDRSARFLLAGMDESGKRCCFFRISTTGLYRQNLAGIARVLNHTTLANTAIYARLNLAPVQSALFQHADTLLAMGSALARQQAAAMPTIGGPQVEGAAMVSTDDELCEWPG